MLQYQLGEQVNRIGCLGRFITVAKDKIKVKMYSPQEEQVTKVKDLFLQGSPAESAGIRFAAYQKAQKEKE